LVERIAQVLAVACIAVTAVAPAQAVRSATSSSTSATACINRPYSYAGLQSGSDAHGVSGTLVSTAPPAVFDGHVGAWVGVGGTSAGPNGVAEWLQAGFSAFTDDTTSHMYYEVTAAGSAPTYHEIAAIVRPGESHRFAVLELTGRPSWWRVWVDGAAVSPPIHLPGSHGTWAPQAVAENWNGGTGTCNGYAYEFSNLALMPQSGGGWQPFTASYVFQDPGYKVVRSQPTRFLATSSAV
jgi:hypothetical protein